MPNDAGRWTAAFSPRRNLQHLLHRPAGQFPALDGIRALSMLWMVAFHSVFFLGFFLSRDAFVEVISRPSTRPMLHGNLGVDVFFVLSGFLIANLLFGEKDQRGEIGIGRFYARRFLRLIPVYVVALALYSVTVREQWQMCWTNLLYINNFFPTMQQCMGWSWSLAIEEQFYLVFPFFLLLWFPLRRARLAALLGLLLFAFAVRAFVILRAGDAAAEALHPILDRGSYLWNFDHLYGKPHTRYGGILVGVIAAYLYHYKNAARWLTSTPARRFGAIIISLLVLAVVLSSIEYVQTTHFNASPAAFADGVFGRYAFAIAIAALLLISISDEAGLLGRALSWRGFYPVAQLSYSGYLVHPIIIAGGYFVSITRGVMPMPLLLYYFVFVTLTLLLAGILHLAAERPFMNIRR